MDKPEDRNYRGLAVHRDCTNESDSAWTQIESTEEAKARWGRRRSGVATRRFVRCSSAEQRQDAANDLAHFMPTHCAPGTKNDGGRSVEAPGRLRGGGSGEFLDGFLKSDADFMWRNSRFTMPTRLEGGGCGGETSPAAGCGKASGHQQKDNTNPACLVGNRCCRKNSEKISFKPVFRSENDTECVPKKKEYGVCMKKPCLGTDCLIRAFKDTQDFVNSIGKVPGLAGLGIIESPYFPQESKENKKELKPVSNIKQSDAVNHLSNTQNLENSKKINSPSAGFNSATPKKSGVVQEITTNFTDPTQAKSKKKDDKVEKQKELENNGPSIQINEESPCGEPKCKSRPKRASDWENADNKGNNPVDKLSPKSDQKSVKAKPHSGPGGDTRKNSKSNPGKPNQFVYSFGNSYPASVYGHKNCNHLRRRVPAHQGWMWNEADTIANRKPRTGWKPGAISILLRDMMNAAKAGFLNERPKSAHSRSKKNQKVMTFNAMKKPPTCNEEQTEEEANFPPTLHIHRRDGDYYITMYPIRQEGSDVPRVDEPLNPLQFKIVKSKDSLASSSTASDMEIEFSPPAAVNRIKKKPNVVHIETNVTQQDILNELNMLNAEKDGKQKKDKKNKPKKNKECL